MPIGGFISKMIAFVIRLPEYAGPYNQHVGKKMMQKKAVAVMRMMVLSIVAAISLAGISDAQASSASHSSTSFKSGFSSQKKSSSASSSNKSSYDFGNSSKSSDSSDAASKKTGFGSFSKNSDAGAAPSSSDSAGPRSRSLFGKDLDKNAANANALKTLDARNAVKARQDDPARGVPQSAAGGPLYPPAGAPQGPAAAPPVIIQNNGGGSSNGWMWFLLGQSMHGHDRERVIVDRGAGTAVSSNPDAGAVKAAPPEQPGFFMRTLRILFWLGILAAVGGGIYYLAKRKGISKSANYSLGKF